MSQVELLARLQEAFQNAADAIGEYLENLAPADQQKPGWDPSKIKWSPDEGPKGPYERSEDVNNLEHKVMLKDLGQHDGKLYRDGWFYWTFENGHTVGRKFQGKKKSDHASSNPARGCDPHEKMQRSLDNVKAAGEALT